MTTSILALAAIQGAAVGHVSPAAATPAASAQSCVERHRVGWTGPRFGQQQLDPASRYTLRLMFTGSPKAADEAMRHFTSAGHPAFYFLAQSRTDAILIAEVAVKEPVDESKVSLESICRLAGDYNIAFEGWLFSQGLRHLNGYVPD